MAQSRRPSPQSNQGQGSLVNPDGPLKISPNAASAMVEIERIRQSLSDMTTGKADPKKVRAQLERKYYQQVRRNVWAGEGGVAGAKDIVVLYRKGTHVMTMDWRFLPSPTGPSVLGLCPECWTIAPSQVKSGNATKPTFVDGQLARIAGDPEADKKIVPLRITSETHKIWLDERDRLFVDGGLIRCPDKSRCSWVVRIAEGVARRVNTEFTRNGSGGQGGPIKGPAIIVK